MTPAALRRLAAMLAAVAGLLVVPALPASAHPLNTSAVLLDVGARRVTATVELPLDELSVARARVLTPTDVLDTNNLPGIRAEVAGHMSATDSTGRRWATWVGGGRVERVDGVDNLVLRASLTPVSGTVGDFTLHYDAVIDTLVSHRVFVSARYGHSGTYTTLAMLSWQTRSVPVASTRPSDGRGFVAAVQLGVDHISHGSDHLLFLLMLLLPAPLTVRDRRWERRGRGRSDVVRTGWRVVHVVTAFAVGHSVTLALGALGWMHVPERLVEAGIAVSVMVSAVHAVRPLVRRGEVLIGVAFGLLHGLSFAALLGGLDLARGGLVVTLLGFNLGIEVTQLLVVVLVMPSLVALSTTTLYPVLRTGLGLLGAVLAAGWFLQRVGVIPANPLEPVGDLLVDHPFTLAAGLALLALTTAGRPGPQGPHRLIEVLAQRRRTDCS